VKNPYVKGQRVWVKPHSWSVVDNDGNVLSTHKLKKVVPGVVETVPPDHWPLCVVKFLVDGKPPHGRYNDGSIQGTVVLLEDMEARD
jgi:hypothetical protein